MTTEQIRDIAEDPSQFSAKRIQYAINRTLSEAALGFESDAERADLRDSLNAELRRRARGDWTFDELQQQEQASSHYMDQWAR